MVLLWLIQVTKMTQVIALFIIKFFYDMSNLHFPPREPPFEPKPSLYPVCEYLIEQCIKRYAKEKCPLCNERVLPQKPEVRCFFRLLYWVLLKPDVCDLDGFCINYQNKPVFTWDSNFFLHVFNEIIFFMMISRCENQISYYTNKESK